MATYRIGIGSFNLKDGAIGIGTESTGLGNLKVEGTIKTTDLDVTGVSTFTRYSGFEVEQNNIIRDQTLSGEYSTTGDIVVDDGNTLTVGLGSTACIGAVESLSIKNHFSVPVGDTAGRNKSSGYTEGTVRYNKDLGTVEFYNGNEWRQFTYISDIKTNPQGRGRAVFGGGSPSMSHISFVNIMTEGNARDFGDLTYGLGNVAGKCSNGTRGLFAGGGNPVTDTINYITIASEGDGIDFGNLTSNNYGMGGHSSSTRGIWAGGNNGSQVNIIQYVEINTLGNALDFGDLTRAVTGYDCACGDPVRMLHAGGKPSAYEEMIDYWSIASKGNAVDFGDLSQKKNNSTGVSNNTRGVWCRGELSDGVNVTRCDYVTIASTGNATDFGSISAGRYAGGASNQIRGVISGGYASSESNLIEFITIATTGNAVHFGDDTQNRYSHSGLSDSHGGLGGF